MTRRLPAFLFDASLAVTGYLAAWTLRFGADLPLFVPFARRALPLFVRAQIAGAVAAGGYRRLSAATVTRFAIGAALGALGGVGLAHLRFGANGLSHASLAGAAIFFVIAGAGWRALGAMALRRRSARHAMGVGQNTRHGVGRRVYFALMAMLFSGFCAAGDFGSATVSTPFLKLASIFSSSIPSGSWKERWNEPKRRSDT